jgi:predicted Zn-dependent peptidase
MVSRSSVSPCLTLNRWPFSFYVRTVARDEEDARVAGISHFLEHMIFKGTKTLDWRQLKQEFTRIGAAKGGSTSVEYTVYYLRVLGEYLDRSLKLLSDMIGPRIDEHDFETEKRPSSTKLRGHKSSLVA